MVYPWNSGPGAAAADRAVQPAAAMSAISPTPSWELHCFGQHWRSGQDHETTAGRPLHHHHPLPRAQGANLGKASLDALSGSLDALSGSSANLKLHTCNLNSPFADGGPERR